MSAKTLALIAAVLSVVGYATADPIVVCYHGTWSNYRPGNGQFNVDNINDALCTHFIYAFVGINDEGSVVLLDSWLDIGLEGFAKFTALNAKSLLAVGGWNEGSEKYSRMAADPAKRARFTQSAIDLLKEHGFDGFDLDWEYPAQRGGSEEDKENFVSLIREMREAFDKEGFLLTAAVAAAGSSVDISYDVPMLSKYLDFINVMTYDLHGSWDGVTGINAPLYPSSIDQTEAQKALNVAACINGWIERGADPQKLVLGLGTYGRSFTLENADNHGIGAPTTGGGTAGPYTRESGMLGYNEICSSVLNEGWTVVYDEEQEAPYAYKGNQWVGFDNPRSIQVKVDYAKSLNLRGVMVWSVETDDFLGICGRSFDILTAIQDALGGVVAPSDPSTSPPSSENPPAETSPPAADPTTQAPDATNPPQGSDSQCPSEGYFRDPNSCSKFYFCQSSEDGFIVFNYVCPTELYFDLKLALCNWAELVDC